jgi:hypothetical protein
MGEDCHKKTVDKPQTNDKRQRLPLCKPSAMNGIARQSVLRELDDRAKIRLRLPS